MPGVHLTDILRNLIPLQDPQPLLAKVAEAARKVSGADRCLLLHWEDQPPGWNLLAVHPPEADPPIPLAPVAPGEALRDPRGLSWTPDDGVPCPFGPDPPGTEALLTVPLVLPSSNELYGVLCAERSAPGSRFEGRALHSLSTFGNLAALCLENAMLFEQASVDEVTRASTKAFFLKRLEEEYQRSRRTGVPFAVFMTDVDDFKKVNDAHGHLAGDRILRTFVETLKANIRVYDLVGRYGGDEFMVLMPGLDHRNLFPVAQKMSRALQAARYPVPGRVTFSFGGAVHPTHGGNSGLDLLLQADMALYQAKGQGKGRIVILGRETPILSALSPLTRDAATLTVDTKAAACLEDLADELVRAAEVLPAGSECPRVRELAGRLRQQVLSVIKGE